MSHSISTRKLDLNSSPLNLLDARAQTSETTHELEVADLLIAYLNQLGIDYVFGIPGGAIEPLYNALARSERKAGPRAVIARHESGAAFMADGYFRNSGKLGVCCTTTGPGATNAITGVSVAYENDIPMLVITAQTPLSRFGKKAFQESTDTGIDTIGIFRHCTRYSTMISHIEQFETKLVTAVMTAFGARKGPVHLSIPLDILRCPAPVSAPSYNLAALIKTPSTCDINAVHNFSKELLLSKNPVFIIGSGCSEAMGAILHTADLINAKIITTCDGKGLVSPYHPNFRGVIGFAGHRSAVNLLSDSNVDLITAIGTNLGEWCSNGWDKTTILNSRLIHIDPTEFNLTHSPMARLHVRGHLLTVFEHTASILSKKIPQTTPPNIDTSSEPRATKSETSHQRSPQFEFDLEDPDSYYIASTPIKPQWLMGQLPQLFPPNTKFLADTGNSFAWATHYLHPFEQRMGERRLKKRSNRESRRQSRSELFQAAVEFSSMGWAIGSAIGAAIVSQKEPIVAITGDGSWLMSGQEITTAVQEQLCIVYIILNDAALGMVKHGQRLAGAEPIGFELPPVDFCAMAQSVGADGYLISSPADLHALDVDAILAKRKPCVIDVRIDPEQTPPLGLRTRVLQGKCD